MNDHQFEKAESNMQLNVKKIWKYTNLSTRIFESKIQLPQVLEI